MSKSVFFLKENGDTDYDDLLGGLHKSIVLKGALEADSEKLLSSSTRQTLTFPMWKRVAELHKFNTLCRMWDQVIFLDFLIISVHILQWVVNSE